MAVDPLSGQFGGGAGPQDETPIRTLGQQQFAAGLDQPKPMLIAAHPPVDPPDHGPGGPLPFPHNPAVGLIEPVAVIAPPSPAGGRGAAELEGQLRFQGLPQGGETELSGGSLAEQFGQKRRPFKPPVAKQLSVKGSDQQRRSLDGGRQIVQLTGPTGEVIGGMLPHPQGGGGRFVGGLVLQLTGLGGHPMQFQAQGATAADTVFGQLGLGQIPAQVAVKFPVGPVARIALAGTPYRQGRIAVAAEKSHSRWAADRCINAIAGTGYGVKNAVGVQDAVAQAVLDEHLVQTLVVGAFR